jgi:hypothetical protein
MYTGEYKCEICSNAKHSHGCYVLDDDGVSVVNICDLCCVKLGLVEHSEGVSK